MDSRNNDFADPTVGYQPPIPFDPNFNFQFNTSERAEYISPWTNINTTGVTLETPSSYNSTFVNMTFRVINSTWDNQTIINYEAPGASDNVLQAQGFNTTQITYLYGFSIYVNPKSGSSMNTISIRDGAPGGPILAEKTVTIQPIAGWIFIPLDTPVSLSPGHFYVQWPSIGGGNNKAQWMRTNTWTATQDCYINSGSWVAQTFNLTLKIHVKNLLNPESVSMNVSNQIRNQTVLNLGTGVGWANLTAPITGNSIQFSIYNASPIEYSYSANLTAFRASKALNAVNLTAGDATWTLSTFSYPGSYYSVYQANITGFNENHTFIQAFLGQDTVGFSRPPPYTTLIFDSAVDTITFLSTNYVLSGEIPPEVHSDQYVDLNVMVGDIGNISINIYSGSGSVYDNKTYTSGTISFRWHVETALAAGEYTFEATFFNPNNVGFFRQNITLEKVATIDTYNLSVQALDVMRLNFRLFDLYGGSYIPDATMMYYFTDLTGPLQYDSVITHNYTTSINLETYSIHTGPYTLFLEAVKPGYQSILVPTTVNIVKREMDFEVSRSATNLNPGNTLEVGVTPRDRLTGGTLLRPADITIYIYPAGGNEEVDAVVKGTINSTVAFETQSLRIPATAAFGAYDIMIRINSDFYEGSKHIPNSLMIEEPPNLLLYILAVIGIGVVAVSTYVQRQRMLSKRSVRGAIVMNPGGMPIARRISADFSTMNPHLIAGAVMGIVTMVKEMTGSSIRTIALEGRYLKIVLRDAFWFVLLTQRNPSWISGTVKKCVDDLELRYGEEMAAWKGEGNVHISLDLTLQRWFGVDIKESRDPELEIGGSGNPENQEKGDQNPPALPAPPVNP